MSDRPFIKGQRVRDPLTNRTGVIGEFSNDSPDLIGMVLVEWDALHPISSYTPSSRLELLPAPNVTEMQKLWAAIAALQAHVATLEAERDELMASVSTKPPNTRRYLVEGSSDAQANSWECVRFDDLQTAIDYADVLASNLSFDDDTLYIVIDETTGDVRHHATAPSAPLVVTPQEPPDDAPVKLTKVQRRTLEALANGSVIHLDFNRNDKPIYTINNMRVSVENFNLFEEHGWIDGTTQRHVFYYVITDAGREALKARSS